MKWIQMVFSIEDTWKCQFSSAYLSIFHHSVVTSTIVLQKSKIRWLAIDYWEFLAPAFTSLPCAFHLLKPCKCSVSPTHTECTFFDLWFWVWPWDSFWDISRCNLSKHLKWTCTVNLPSWTSTIVKRSCPGWLLAPVGDGRLKEESCPADFQIMTKK